MIEPLQFRVIQDRLAHPAPRGEPPWSSLALAWWAPPDDPDWPTPTTLDEARALLARLGDGQCDVCIRAGMQLVMRAERTDACLVAAVGNDRLDRLMQQLGDLLRRYRAALGREDDTGTAAFLALWWRRCRCRLAFADAPTCELEVIDHRR